MSQPAAESLQSPFASMPLSRELAPIGDPRPGTPEAEMASLRHSRAVDVGSMYWLPQLPDEWARTIYERVDEAERHYVAPHRLNAEYADGTATRENDVAEVVGVVEGGVIFTAEHATKTPRLDKETGTFSMGFADDGTAGMAAVLAEDLGQGYIMRGRQTRPLADDEFALKPYILRALPDSEGFISVHGCSSRAFVDPTDPTGIHAYLGLGIDPTDAERAYAEEIVQYGRNELGLYVVMGNDQKYYVQTGPGGALRR